MRSVLTTLFLALLLSPVAGADDDPFARQLAERLKQHVRFLAADSLEGRGLGTSGKVEAKNYIASHFREFNLETHGDDYFQRFELRSTSPIINTTATNVVGYIPGSDPALRDQFIVVGAHYDHIGFIMRGGEKIVYPGADDNASGTATVIELARYFDANREAIGRSIIFIAFDAEESGLLGARHFVAGNKVAAASDMRAMFSIDMVGMYSTNEGLMMMGVSTFNGGRELAESVAARHGVPLTNTAHRISYRTDTKPFGDLSIPAIYTSTGLESPYHQPEDRYDLLDYDGMATTTLYLADFIAELSNVPDIEPTRRLAATQRAIRFHAGVIANAGGTSHNYPDDFFNAKGLFGYGAGLFLQLKGSGMTLQPEVLYESYGSRTADGRFRAHSITVPLNLQLHLPSAQQDMVRMYGFLGPYYRHIFSGRKGENDLDFDTGYKRDEIGFSFGLGMEVLKLQFAWTYRTSAGTITQSTTTDIRQTGSLFTVGYRF